jgi:hypothetical protein
MSFVVKAVKNVVKSVVKVVTGVVKAVVNLASSVINFVIQPFMGLLGGIPSYDQNSAATAQAQGILIQVQGSTEAIPIVYGFRKLAGKVVYVETGNTNNKYLWVAYAYCEGPVEGLRNVSIDDNELPSSIIGDLNAGKTVSITTGKYAKRVQLQWFPGVYFSDPSTSPVGTNSLASAAPSWKKSNVYNGVAVLFARYEWFEIKTQADSDANPFSGNVPVVAVTLLGRRIQSLMTGSGTSTLAYGVGERYSTNPAEVLLDYLRNPRYGKGLAATDIDWTSFTNAANKCNQQVEYITGTYGPIHTFNGVIDPNQTIFNNVKLILQQFRAYLPYVQGKYKLRIEDAGNATDILSGVATINATAMSTYKLRSEFANNPIDIMGDIVYTGIDKTSKYNQVAVTYVDPDQKWSNQSVVYPETEAERQVYITEDGGRENKLEITFPAITNYAIAKDFARLLFNKSRYQETCSLRVSSQAFELEPGDNIYIQSNILNFDVIPWRIVSIKINDDYSFDLGCVRNPDFIYPHTRVGEIDQVVSTFLPKGAEIYFPANATNVLLGLTPPTNAYLNGTTTNAITNPAGTNPTANVSIGGGVGGANGSINTGGVTTNPATTAAVKTKPLDDTCPIDNITYSLDGANTYATLTTKQPANSAYTKLSFYYKRSIASETVWTLLEVSDLPGQGLPITFKIGPLLQNNVYAYKVLAYYGGTASINFVTGTFTVSAAGISQDPTDTIQVTASAWTNLNTTALTKTARNNTLDWVTGGNLTANVYGSSISTVTSDPRVFRYMFRQNLSEAANFDVTGVVSYIRPVGGTYYAKYVTSWPDYVPGNMYIPVFDDGIFGSWNTDPNYEIIIRLLYKDGSESTMQHRATFNIRSKFDSVVTATGQFVGTTLVVSNILTPGQTITIGDTVAGAGVAANTRIVSQSTGSTGLAGNYIVNNSQTIASQSVGFFDTTAYPVEQFYGTGITKAEPAGTVAITTWDQAPANAAVGGENIVIGLSGIYDSGNRTPQSIRFVFHPPVVADRQYWRGMRVRYRSILPGTNPAFIQFDDKNTYINSVTGLVGDLVVPAVFGTSYEIVLTPLYNTYVSGVPTINECVSSWYIVGDLDNLTSSIRYPVDNNWKPLFKTELMATTTALSTVSAAFSSADPVIQIVRFTNILDPLKTGGQTGKTYSSDFLEESTQLTLSTYLQLEYYQAHISSYNELQVYRRHNQPNTVAGGLITYQGVGRWERVTVTTTSASNIIINLRGPTSALEFGPLYPNVKKLTTTPATYVPTTYGANVVSVSSHLDFYATPNTPGIEYLFVVKSGGVVSNKGLLVYVPNIVTPGSPRAEQLIGVKPTVVNLSDYNNYAAGLQRNLNEARTTPLTADKLSLNNYAMDSSAKRIGYLTPPTGPAIV